MILINVKHARFLIYQHRCNGFGQEQPSNLLANDEKLQMWKVMKKVETYLWSKLPRAEGNKKIEAAVPKQWRRWPTG
jgi:hypothetical protein